MNNTIEIICFILSAVLSYWISAVIHELGHVVVGLVHGWKLFLFVVGPIGIKRKNGKLKLYIEKDIAMWGGAGGTFPVKESEHNISVWSKILLGGPVASITMGIIFLVLYFLLSHYFLLMLGLMLISMGIVCLLPLKSSITYTDGKRWCRLHNGGKEEAEEVALLKMSEYEQFGKDKSLIQKEDFEVLLGAEHPVLRYCGYCYLYQYYDYHKDYGNKAKVFDVLAKMKKDVPKIIIEDYKL